MTIGDLIRKFLGKDMTFNMDPIRGVWWYGESKDRYPLQRRFVAQLRTFDLMAELDGYPPVYGTSEEWNCQ